MNPTLLGHKIDRVHILPSGQVIDTERKGTVGQQCQVVTGFNIERQIHTEIVGNTITVTVYLSHAFEEIQLSGNQSVISERKPGAYREIYIITDKYWER